MSAANPPHQKKDPRPQAGPPKDAPEFCEHTRRQIIARDENGQFEECLDCRQIFEAGELDEIGPSAAYDEPDADRSEEPGDPGRNEDLSDA